MGTILSKSQLVNWAMCFFSIAFLFSCSEPSTIKPQELKRINIQCDSTEFSEIYANFSEDIYIPIVIVYDTLQCSAKMRVRGDTSREKKKKSLKVVFDDPGIEGLPKILNLNAEFKDKTYMRQFISSELMKESGQVCFDTEHIEVQMNDEFFGLYLLVENIGKSFLVENGLSKKGHLYKATRDGACLSPHDNILRKWEKKTHGKGDYRHLKMLIDGLAATPDSEFYSFINTNFEYEKLINILAMNMLISNGSTYSHNYYMYHDSYGTGLWQMLPWDMDKTLYHYAWLPYQYHKTSSNWISDNVLVERCFLDERIMEDIKNRIDELHKDVFNRENVQKKINSLTPIIRGCVEKDTTDLITDLEDWLDHLDLEIEFVERHYSNLKVQLNECPQVFSVENFNCLQTDTMTFNWNRSIHPMDREITYTLTYSKDFLLEKDTTVIHNLSDTSFTLNSILLEGRYYWMVRAGDGRYWIDGFNTRSVFDVKHGTPLNRTISENQVLTADKSPYLIRESLVIADGATLEIEPGVELHFGEEAFIECNGNIRAVGSLDHPIKFIPDNNSKSWEHIQFNESSEFGVFEYVTLHEGLINARETNLSFKYCTFELDQVKANLRKTRHPIIMHFGGKIELRNSRFIGNGHSEGMNIISAESIVENCTFNFVPDAIEFISVNKGSVRNNYVFNSPDDGIDFNTCNEVDIQGNYIVNCQDKGVSIGKDAFGGPMVNILLEDNLLIGSATGIAIKDSSICEIRNNTIIENAVGIDAHVKREGFKYGGVANISNSIFKSNKSAALKADEFSTIELKQSLIDERHSGGDNIIDEAIFMDEEGGDYRLHPSSPGYKGGDKGMSPGAIKDEQSPIMISKAHIKSSEHSPQGDWIEIKNGHTLPFDLSLYKIVVIREGMEKSFTFPKGSVLEGMSSFFVVSKYDRYLQDNSDLRYTMASLPRLTRQETSISLLNKEEIVMDRVSYNEQNNLSEDITLDFEVQEIQKADRKSEIEE